MRRISISLPEELLFDFDEVLGQRGYQSRSKGIRDALKDYIVRCQWMNEMEGNRFGMIAVTYDHRFNGVMESLVSIQHNFRDEIISSMRIHVNDVSCMESIVVNGDVNRIRDLTEKMKSLKGVEHVKLISIANGEELSKHNHHNHHHEH